MIGRFWVAHHTVLAVMDHHVPALVWPNIVLLLCVAFMPFATAFMAENLSNNGAALFYDLALMAVAICSAWVVAVATRPGNAREDFTEIQRRQMRARSHGVIVATAIAAIGVFFMPWPGSSQALLASMPLIQRLLVRLYSRKSAMT